MLIVCPNCKKRFEVDPGRAEEAKKFRCSSCRAVFRLVRKGQGAAPPAPAPAATAATVATAPAAAPAPPETSAPTVAPAAPAAAPQPEAIAAGLKVVVANESVPFCEAVKKVLASEPFQLFVCNDGKLALETVERVRPDLLLLDVALPTMFGFEVCERVRQNPELASVKIVLIASIYDKTRYKRSPNSLYGADDYIEKHHIPDSLVPMIYRLTSGSVPVVAPPSAQELQAQEESRSEIREAEVRETCQPTAPAIPVSAVPEPDLAAPPAAALADDPAGWTFASLELAAPAPVAAPSALPQHDATFAGAQAEELMAAPSQPEPETHKKARRLARIIVSDIVLYNQGKVEQGVRDGNLYDLLADDIREGERLYRQRVSEEVREATAFLTEAFEDLIAKKRAELRI
jgi:CheY-like chemotaxis protein